MLLEGVYMGCRTGCLRGTLGALTRCVGGREYYTGLLWRGLQCAAGQVFPGGAGSGEGNFQLYVQLRHQVIQQSTDPASAG